ncbi:hypothetical protein [Nonomuraea sp. NPDC002799]
MRNGVRHLIGAGVGVLAVPVIAAGVMYGSAERYEYTLHGFVVDWIGVAAYLGTALVIGALAGSRLSPLASLLPGLAFGGLVTASLVRMGLGGDHLLGFGVVPRQYFNDYLPFLHTWAPVIAGVLLAASAFPSRWRQAVRPAPPEPPQMEEAEAPPPLPKRIPSRY